MTQERLRLAALTVVGGPLDGRRCALEEVVAEVLIGSDADCTLVIDMPGVSPIHARIWADLDASTVRDTHAPRGVYVNATRVAGEAQVKPRDLIWLGPPGDPQSVCILPEFEAWVERIPAPAVAAPAATVPSAPPMDSGYFDPQTFEPEALEAAAAAEVVEAVPGFDPQAIDPEALEAEADALSAPRVEPRVQAVEGETLLEPEAEPLEIVAPEAAQDMSAPAAQPEPATRNEPAPLPGAFDFDAFESAVNAPAAPAPEAADPFFVADEPPAAPPPDPSPGTEQGRGLQSEPAVPPVEESTFGDDFALAEVAEAQPVAASRPASAAAADAEAEATFDADFATEAEPVVAVSAEPLMVTDAPAGGAQAAIPDDDMWAISAEPDTPPAAAPPEAAPVPETAGDDFFLAEPEAGSPLATPSSAPADVDRSAEAPWLTTAAPPAAPGRPVPGSATGHAAAAPPPPAAPLPAPPPVAPPPPPATPRAAAPSVPMAPPATVAEGEAPHPVARPGASRKPAAARPVGGKPAAGPPRWLLPVAGVAALIVIVVIAAVAWSLLAGRVRIEAIGPQPLRVGQTATLRGSGFSETAAENTVTFGGQPARVLSATATTIEVEVPPLGTQTGSRQQTAVVVRSGSRSSEPVSIEVLEAPLLQDVSPRAALPGEPVILAGTGWGSGARVRFGDVEAQVVEVSGDRIRTVVPPMTLPPGSPAPIVVSMAGVDSKPAVFVIGQLPLITAISPQEAAPGDVVQIAGLGFDPNPLANSVSIAGAPALVVAAGSDELRAVVPRIGAGDPARVVEVRVPGSANVAQATLNVAGFGDTVQLRFVAEPFGAVPGRPHAVLATPLGPAFVLSAAAGRSAAERAAEAQARLNAAVAQLQASPGVNLEARQYDSSPVIGLAGQTEALIEVAEEDAAAYNEDWTGLRGRGGPVTRARLARWWEAVGRDLVLLLLRDQRPRFAAALAQEGRVLGQVFDQARRSGRTGVPRQILDAPRSPLRDGLRTVALRVPPTVAPPAAAVPATPAAPTPTPPPALKLEGTFRGRETEDGQIRYITVAFSPGGGTVTYEGGITFSVPLMSVSQPSRDQVRYSLRMRGGVRHYSGRWDGETITGQISTDPAGRDVVGSFELRR